jgi:multimeric flavodoxin WrbA
LKIFVYSGSPKDESSTGYKFIKKVEKYLNEANFKFSIKIYTADKLNIKESNGEATEFSNGESLYDDDMVMLEKAMLESDLIIFISPVYAHNVSSQMKKFIDRIAYWLHLYKLIGRMGYIVSVSSNNGNDIVNDYLKQMMEYLGLYVLGTTSIQTAHIGKDDKIIDSYARFLSNKILFSENSEMVEIPFSQEKAFQIQKAKYIEQSQVDFEKNYWVKQGFFNYETFEELFMDRMRR